MPDPTRGQPTIDVVLAYLNHVRPAGRMFPAAAIAHTIGRPTPEVRSALEALEARGQVERSTDTDDPANPVATWKATDRA